MIPCGIQLLWVFWTKIKNTSLWLVEILSSNHSGILLVNNFFFNFVWKSVLNNIKIFICFPIQLNANVCQNWLAKIMLKQFLQVCLGACIFCIFICFVICKSILFLNMPHYWRPLQYGCVFMKTGASTACISGFNFPWEFSAYQKGLQELIERDMKIGWWE